MMENGVPALRLAGLRKAFGRPAVDGLDLEVRRGELYALLGPNGAGKTTTLRMVTGLLAPDAGSIDVLGIDLAAAPAAAKMKIMEECGITVVESPAEIGETMVRVLGKKK